MAVTPALIKELRELTGAGMSDCKAALTESNGDIQGAVDWLRQKGLSSAAKKAGRIAAEGVVHTLISDDGKSGVIVEVNSETDFVAKNEDFQTFVKQVAACALASDAKNIEEFLAGKWFDDSAATVSDALTGKVAVIGEKLDIRRFEKIVKDTPGVLATYIHGGGKFAALLDVVCDNAGDVVKEAGKNICMQIVAMQPQYVKKEDIPGDFLEKEREILMQQTIEEGKPANIAEKMVTGRLAKRVKELCVLDQEYVKDTEITVGQYLDNVSKEVGAAITLKHFVCYERGEGIAKKEENFADEVNKVMQG